MDLDLAAHLYLFVEALPLKEKIGLVLSLITAILSLVWFFWWFGYKRGFFFGKLEEYHRTQSIRLSNKTLETNNRDLRNELVGLRKEVEIHKAGGVTDDEQKVLEVRVQISRGTGDTWSLRESGPPIHLAERLTYNGTKVILIGNLKGGVGKTTIASNLAAYFDKRLNKKVLVVDFDYQGSLSSIFLRASGQTLPGSLADVLLSGSADRKWLLEDSMSIGSLQNTKFIPATYSIASTEERLMLQWLFYKTKQDVRFDVAESFLQLQHNPSDFDVIIIDVGPRLTTAFIAAICASTHLIIPTNLDRLAAETIESFLKRVKDIKAEFSLPIKLAGVVTTLMPAIRLTGDEEIAETTIQEGLQIWGEDRYLFKARIPRLKAITHSAGANIGYLLPGAAGASVRRRFDTLGDELIARIGL